MKDINSRIDKEKGVIYLTEKERTAQLIKPILRGRDIKRYSYEWAGLWIINVHNGYTMDDSSLGGFCGSLDLPHCKAQKSASHSSNPTQPTKSTQDTRIVNVSTKDSKTQTKESQKIKIPPIDIDEYPTLKAYFDKVASEGKQGKGKGFYNRDDKGITPYNLRNCAYLPEFAKPKIVYSEIVREPQFYLDNGEFKFGYFYAEATSFILTANCHSELSQESEESLKISKKDISGKSPQYDKMQASLEYLLGILHSKLATFAFREFYAGGGLGESGYRYKKAFLENLPIPKITQSQEAEFIKIVNEIIKCKKSLQYSNLKSLSQKGVYPPPVPLNPEKDTAFSAINGEASLNPLLVQNQREDTSASLDSDFGTPRSGREKDSDNKEELQELESRLDSLESKLNSLVFSLYGLSDEEIRLVELAGGGASYSLALLLIASIESKILSLVKLLCENFELELKEAFRFCKGLQVPREYEGKIIYPNMAKEFIAYLDNQGFFTNQKCFILTDKCKDKNRLLYLTAVLNSKMNFWYFKQIGATLGANGYEMSKIFVEKLPVVETNKIDSTLLKEIENITSEILESKAKNSTFDTSALESQIDNLVYKLYNFTNEEIKTIENKE